MEQLGLNTPGARSRLHGGQSGEYLSCSLGNSRLIRFVLLVQGQHRSHGVAKDSSSGGGVDSQLLTLEIIDSGYLWWHHCQERV